MIIRFDSNSLKHVRAEAEKVLSKLGEELGVNFTLGNIRYQENTFSTKLEGSIAGFDTRANDWNLHYRKFNLEKEWLHKTFDHGRKTYRVVGLRPKARKQTVLVESDGNTYQIEDRLLRLKFQTPWAGSNRQYNCDTGEVA
tara:strand:- start:433 stop:855 length:423 start_codon:yes stop_codon:yes gene_type:complete